MNSVPDDWTIPKTIDEIDAAISAIDVAIHSTINAVLHHPEFQRLEASWCGLRRLVFSVPEHMAWQQGRRNATDTSADGVLISVLNVSKAELLDDCQYSSNVRSTVLHQQLYQFAYNVYGGIPFSLVLGDYEFCDDPEDIFLLKTIGTTVSNSFTVFVGSASPSLLRCDRFADLYSLVDAAHPTVGPTIEDLFENRSEWQALRQSPESRFLSLALPRMLARRPYDYRNGLGVSAKDCGWRDRDDRWRLKFRERISADGAAHLWCSAAYGFAMVACQSYVNSGWLANIHGIPSAGVGGGVVDASAEEAPLTCCHSDRMVSMVSTEVLFSETLERQLTRQGLLTLVDQHGMGTAAFCNTPSLHSITVDASTDEQISSMLQYTLCITRFAHAIKALGHQKVGNLSTADTLRATLNQFLSDYALKNPSASHQKKAEKPLRNFDVKIAPVPGQDGHFHCRIMLQLHHELDAVEVQLQTEIVGVDSSDQ